MKKNKMMKNKERERERATPLVVVVASFFRSLSRPFSLRFQLAFPHALALTNHTHETKQIKTERRRDLPQARPRLCPLVVVVVFVVSQPGPRRGAAGLLGRGGPLPAHHGPGVWPGAARHGQGRRDWRRWRKRKWRKRGELSSTFFAAAASAALARARAPPPDRDARGRRLRRAHRGARARQRRAGLRAAR